MKSRMKRGASFLKKGTVGKMLIPCLAVLLLLAFPVTGLGETAGTGGGIGVLLYETQNGRSTPGARTDGEALFTVLALKAGEETPVGQIVPEAQGNGAAQGVLEGLPAGEYLVRAQDASWDPSEQRVRVEQEGLASAVFRRDREITGELLLAAAPAEGRDADTCYVTVTLSDAGINGTYGEAVFAFGRASLRLSSGEQVLIPGLPADVGYTVSEEEGLAEILYPETEDLHRIRAGQTETVTLVRPQNTLGRLALTCRCTGSDADTEQVFFFRVRVEGAFPDGRYGEMTFENGEASVGLKDGETCAASGLPDGARYGIECENTPEETFVSSSGETGVLKGGRESSASFVFARHTGLGISLTDRGNASVSGRAFRIRVQLTDAAGAVLTEYSDAVFRAGGAVLAMTDGETVCLDLPEGAGYLVTPEDAEADGYTMTCPDPLSGTAGGWVHIGYTRNTYGGLRITASGSGTEWADPVFVLTLNDSTLSGRFGDVLLEEGVSSDGEGGHALTLEKGTVLSVTGLPNGTEYTLSVRTGEDAPEAWKADSSRGVITGTSPDAAAAEAEEWAVLSPWRRIAPDPLPAEVTFADGKMTLRGAVALLDGQLEEGQFAFAALEDGRTAAACRNGADGEVLLESSGIREGVHTWTVSQVDEGLEGIVCDTTVRRIVFRVERDASGALTGEVLACSDPLVFAPRRTSVRFCTATASGRRTRGTQIRVEQADGETAVKWTSDGRIRTVYGLGAGLYTWQALRTEGTFLLTEDGAVLQDGKRTDCVLIPDGEETPLFGLIKTDADGNALKGAVIEVRDRYGNVADSWTTDERVHWMNGLKDGETYTLVETRPAEGYAKWTGEMTLNGGKVETDLEKREEEGAVILTLRTEKPSIRVLVRDEETGLPVTGAVLSVLDGDGQTAAEWTSGETPCKAEGLSTLGEYVLWVSQPAAGYRAMTEGIAFRVDETGAPVTDAGLEGRDTLVLPAVRNALAIGRTDAETGEGVPGAVLVLEDREGRVLDEWTCGAGAHLVRGLETGREVIVREKTAPDGYLPADAVSGVQTDADAPAQITVSSSRNTVRVLRVDGNGALINGEGRWQVLDGNGVPWEEWTGSVHEIRGLKAGEWTVRELTPPAGFVRAQDGTVTVTQDGSTAGPVILKGKKTSLSVSVLDAAKGTPLSGAVLQVLDREERPAAEWTCGEEAYVLEGLSVLTPYLLREVSAPENYGQEADIPFCLDEEGRLEGTDGEELAVRTRRQTCELMITNIIQGEISQQRFAYRLEMRLEGRRWPENLRYTVLNGRGEVLSSGLLISGVSVECGPDETICLTGLPAGTEYTVTELDHGGFFCLVSVNGGRASMSGTARGILTDPDRMETVVFTNAAAR